MSESKTPRSDAAKKTYFWNDVEHTFVDYSVSAQIETELAASKVREDNLANALEFIRDECDWEPGGDHWNKAGDKRIGPACDKALKGRAAK